MIGIGKWGEFVFNAPYTGDVIEKINDVILPKDNVEFMKKHNNGGEGDLKTILKEV